MTGETEAMLWVNTLTLSLLPAIIEGFEYFEVYLSCQRFKS
jgi:hypothetical protein